ncbi:MAG: metallophosphoesterase [Deltaproteobacteria bacterium]|nr:MAG: metallophosphoesterase [Deltaproteobacteria bacterium]
MRVAHLSDVHVSNVSATLARMWWGKRLLGGGNMLLNRRKHMPNANVPRVVQHILEQKPDAVLISGDLSTTALEAEFMHARQWLEPLISVGPVVCIPGNHDMYTRGAQRKGLYAKYFAEWHGEGGGEEGYPFARELSDDVVCIGMNTSVPTDYLGSWGILTEGQLERLPGLLQQYKDRFRILMIHHFLEDKRGTPGLPKRGLRNRDALLAILAEHGSELILHGHEHACYQYTVPGPNGSTIPVLNSGPTTMVSADPVKQGGYQMIEMEGQQVQRVVRYGLQPDHSWQSMDISVP